MEQKDEQELLSIEGMIEKIIYQNEENGYTVCELLAPSDEYFVLVGSMPYLCEGESISALGNWVMHPSFGRQFKVEFYEKQLPATANMILKYLSSGAIRGIGPSTAKKIVAQYGDDTLEVLENHPEWLADIPGISARKARDIGEIFRTQFGMRNVMMFCSAYLSPSASVKVYQKWGTGAIDMIRENPYILCGNIHGIGFEKADMIAKDLGIRENSEERIAAGLAFVLSYNLNQNGHVYLPQEKLIPAALKLLGCTEEEAEDELARQVMLKKLRMAKINGRSCIYLPEAFEAEKYICAKMDALEMTDHLSDVDNLNFLIEKAELENGIRYESLQKKAIMEAVKNSVFVLTGGPGTGKTTVVRAIIRIFRSMGLEIALATPTGRAAKRLSEVSGMEAKTIHRMLEMERKDDAQTVFNRNERNPIEETVVIVDESSMIDLSLMDALMRALRRRAKLILIGDSNQLPSVGAGNVLADLIACGAVYTVCLTEIFRQSGQSLIVTNAHRIHEGEAPILTATDNDFFFVQREQEATIASAVADLITVRLPKAYGKQICGKIQVITPSRKGVGGVEQLNALLQERINPKGKFKNEKESHGVIFRVGDRVMQICNNYEIEWEKNGVAGAGLFNGDIGVIEQIDMANRSVRVCFDDKTASYGFDQLDELELAYAITVHKSQGSEYPVVVIPLYACPPMLRTRNLFYTAVTRAKEMVILVGQRQIVADMVKNDREILRYTTLKERIAEYFEDNSQRF